MSDAPLFNPFDPAYQADPYPTFHRMRSADPVHWSETFQAWFLSRHREVDPAARDPRLSSARRTSAFCRGQFARAGLDIGTMGAFVEVSDLKMDDLDAPDHDRIRKVVNPTFRAAALDAIRPHVAKAVDELIERAPTDRFDLAPTLAQPLPWTVISELLHIPAGDREKLRSWADMYGLMFASPIDALAENGRAAEEAVQEYRRYVTAMVRERQASPGDDLASHLASAVREGTMSEDECVSQMLLILAAGTVTVTDTVNNGMHTLLTHPEALALLKERPELTASAVEELLRFRTSIPWMNRIAREDLEIGGTLVRAGQVVFLGFGARNRDPELFEDPDRFHITRKGPGHLSFGYGAHFCVGAALARIETEAMLRALLQRMPEIQLDPDAPPVLSCESLMFRGFKSLPVIPGPLRERARA